MDRDPGGGGLGETREGLPGWTFELRPRDGNGPVEGAEEGLQVEGRVGALPVPAPHRTSLRVKLRLLVGCVCPSVCWGQKLSETFRHSKSWLRNVAVLTPGIVP